jgi:uncharacterized protein (TIGR03067 family)
MKPRPLLAPLAALLLWLLSLNAAARDGKDAIKEEMKRLEGVWVVVSGKEGDKVLDTSRVIKFIFSGDKVIVEGGFFKSDPVVFRLRPTKNPKRIDVEERKPSPSLSRRRSMRQRTALDVQGLPSRLTKTKASGDGWRWRARRSSRRSIRSSSGMARTAVRSFRRLRALKSVRTNMGTGS